MCSPRAFVAAIVFAVMALVAPRAVVSADDPATRVLAEAEQLVEQARQAPALRERWPLYEAAFERLRGISEVYPTSDLADHLRGEEGREGNLYAEIKRRLLETGKAVCEEEFTATCVLRLAFDTHRIAGPFYPDAFLLDLSKARAAAGDIDGALVTAEKLSVFSLREAAQAIVTAMVNEGNLAVAIETARGFHGHRVRDGSLLAVVEALAGNGDVDNGRRVAAGIEDAGDRARALATLAAASRSAGVTHEGARLFAEAVLLAESVGDAEARATLLLEIAEIQLVAGDAGKARETITRALSAAEAITDVYRRSSILRSTTLGFENAGLSSEALDVVEEFRLSAARIDETRDATSELIEEAERAHATGDTGRAKALLAQARAVALGMASQSSREYALDNVIRLRAAMGDIEGALADWALNSGSRYARKDISEALARIGDIEGLRRVLDGVDSDTSRESLLTWTVIPTLAHGGRLAAAREFAGRIPSNSLHREQAMVSVVEGEATADDFDAALRTANSLGDVSTRAKALRRIAAVYLARGRVADAKDVLLRAFRGMFGPGGILSMDRPPSGSYVRNVYVSDAEAVKDIGKLLTELE